MRNLKRFLAMTLTMLMVVGCCSAMFSVNAFDDVTDYQQQIELMNTLKIVEGKDDTTFGFGEDVQRWHMALWIAKIMTGKVDDAYVNWYETTNYTDFTDVNADQFLGSISYASDNGIIKGYANTTYFGPADGITFQDAFTMVVRMLGYGSAAMDATYPWSYINKAIELGLDDGLAADYNNEDVATREEIVVILYNAIFAPKADGSNYAAAKFNLTMDTVVITGTVKGNMYQTNETISKKDAEGNYYVAFNALNADGTIAASPTYYLPKTQFAALADATDLDIALAVGSSFDVVTRDDFTTILYSKKNDSYVIDQDSFTGAASASAEGPALKINNEDYKAVNLYSALYNNQGTKTTADYEIVLKDTTGNNVTGAGSYLRDANLNIMSKADNTKVALYWIPTTLAVNATYPSGVYQKLVSGTYGKADALFVDPTDADWDLCATTYSTTKYGFADIVKTYAGVTARNAYSDTVLFDDDNDGDYDRGLYTYYNFGFIDYNSDKYLTIDGTKIAGDTAYTAITYIDADKYFDPEATEYEITAADIMTSKDTDLAHGNYVLYSYNQTTKVMTIKKIYTPVVGFVTTVNRPAATITFDQVYYGYNAGNVTGSTYAIGKATLPGATYNDVVKSLSVDFSNYTSDNLDSLKGRTIKYVLDEKYSAVLDMYEVADNAGYLVFVDYANSVNTNGYVNALVYANSNVRSVVTIASIDGYTNVATYGANNTLAGLASGNLYKFTVDALGMYHLQTIAYNEFTYYYDNVADDATTANVLENNNAVINFKNSVAYPSFVIGANTKYEADGINFDNNKGVATKFAQFDTDANSIIIVTNLTGNSTITNNVATATREFVGSKGIPSDSAITLNTSELANIMENATTKRYDSRVFVAVDGDGHLDFMYVVDGAWSTGVTFNTSTGSYLDSNDTIIFVDEDTVQSMVATNQTYTGNGVSVGTVYKYTDAIDFIRGGLTSVYTSATYNQALKLGSFYYVNDGYITGEVTIGGADVQVVKLDYIDTFYSEYTLKNGTPSSQNFYEYKKNLLYYFNGTEVTDTSSSDKTPLNMMGQKSVVDATKTNKEVINAYNSYASAYAYTGAKDYSAAKRVFIYENITSGTALKVNKDFTAAGPFTTIANATSATQTFQSATSPIAYYQITEEAYNAFSAYAASLNNNSNVQIPGLGTTLRVYDTTGKEIAAFNSANVTLNTQANFAQKGTTYYLVVTGTVGGAAVKTGLSQTLATDNVVFVWTNDALLTSYKLTLAGVDVKGNAATVADYMVPVTFTDGISGTTVTSWLASNDGVTYTAANSIWTSAGTDYTASLMSGTHFALVYRAPDTGVSAVSKYFVSAGNYNVNFNNVTVVTPDNLAAMQTKYGTAVADGDYVVDVTVPQTTKKADGTYETLYVRFDTLSSASAKDSSAAALKVAVLDKATNTWTGDITTTEKAYLGAGTYTIYTPVTGAGTDTYYKLTVTSVDKTLPGSVAKTTEGKVSSLYVVNLELANGSTVNCYAFDVTLEDMYSAEVSYYTP